MTRHLPDILSLKRDQAEKCCCSRHRRQQQQQQSWSLHTVILQAAGAANTIYLAKIAKLGPLYRAEKYSNLEQWFILLTRGQIYCLQ